MSAAEIDGFAASLDQLDWSTDLRRRVQHFGYR
jgi:hypothetical protein